MMGKYLVFVIFCVSLGSALAEESDSDLFIGPLESIDEPTHEHLRSYYETTCLGFQSCVGLSKCPDLHYEAAKACYFGDKSLFCGTSGSEPMVCCSRGDDDPDSNPAPINQDCGKSLVRGQFYKGLGAFPFVARVGFKNANSGNLAYPCTGSIISRRVILTAAHCALAKADGHRLSSVRIGEYDTSRDPDCAGSGFCAPPALNHAISHVVVHPDYEVGKYHHDIALLILRTPINFTVAAQPLCLYPDRTNLIVGKRATVVGWGRISSISIKSSEMQFLEVPLAPWDLCLKVYGSTGALQSPKSIEGQWLCAGGENRDACQGFGGAPLVIREENVYHQIGIMSFGSDSCGSPKIPSVYTSISFFYQWIQDNIPVE
ncbi:venom protease-like [Phlebotomus argentipes]|uniref:venom protease-like n=1 Tax=Phlebotomus argentipes TaxID=94469 RepID=UPI002892BF21|nr:venom protease-like [Phlebotomus argentipes]